MLSLLMYFFGFKWRDLFPRLLISVTKNTTFIHYLYAAPPHLICPRPLAEKAL